ncbi:MAG: hypothetical protein KME35_01425 [Aphanocapsa sp. GSE-SYN-MK-11-07L]|jgi:hypothetical protein|nr:hypothetical protein [Aphanocapsa sp. GSE-SYN-MK-11-07L]
MATEQQQDGHLIYYPAAQPAGRPKLLLHINGVTSPIENQQRDLESLVWLTLEQPFDVIGIHNSTNGFQSDLLESLIGKAELFRFWPEHQTPESQARLQSYADLLKQLCQLDLNPAIDVLTAVTDLAPPMSLDPELIRRLPFIQKMGWAEFETYFYGSYPASAPRPTLRLAYEMIKGIRAGAEIFVVAHSQGTIIAAIALHILQRFFGDYDHWVNQIRLIGYGPVILFADLPVAMRSQTVLIQHRQDVVAESLSNLRNVGLWNNLQSQLKNLLDNSSQLLGSINNNSYHSASLYLGLLDTPASDRSAKLISLLLTQNWQTSPLVQALCPSRIILEETAADLDHPV